MSRSTFFLAAGAVLFLTGGAVLAFGDGAAWTSAGTSLGLGGLALLGWVWWMKGDR